MEDESETKRIIRRPGMPTRIITPPKTPKAPGGDRNRGRLTITTATGGEDERTRSVAAFRRRMQRLTGNRQAEQKERLSREVVGFVQAIRGRELFKAPGVAETLDWAQALVELDAVALDPTLVADTMGVLLKYQDDIARMGTSEVKRILDDVRTELSAA